MIHNLETERKRIEEALEVLRRLHQIRKPAAFETPSPRESIHEGAVPSSAEKSMGKNGEQPD